MTSLERFALSKIVPRHAYFDTKSFEKSTGITAKKYKVAGNRTDLDILGVYPFFVTTSNKATCDLRMTLVVQENEWEDRQRPYFLKDTSYIDIKRIEALSEVELLGKIQDGSNGFMYAARLPESKFEEMKRLKTRVPFAWSKTTKKDQQIIVKALSETGGADEALQKLGLG